MTTETTIIVPCAGRSSRYPGHPPKWMLSDSAGQVMLERALAGIDTENCRVIVTILEEHDAAFGAVDGIHRSLEIEVEVVALPQPTASQPQTIAETIARAHVSGSILIKDSDNHFCLAPVSAPHGYVCTELLDNFDSINPRNKSYVRVDHTSLITAIKEKKVISNQFSVGGYYFTSAADFVATLNELERNQPPWSREMYVSDVIEAMILNGEQFFARPVTQYEDWGTIEEWRRALRLHRTIVVEVDGFLFPHGSVHFAPRFSDLQPNPEVVGALQALADRGQTIMYLSYRPESLRGLTEDQFRNHHIPFGSLLMNCPLGRTAVLGGGNPFLPGESGTAMEISPEDDVVISTLVDRLS